MYVELAPWLSIEVLVAQWLERLVIIQRLSTSRGVY